MEIKVYTQFDPPPYDGAVMGGECIVETAGYIPAEVQIAGMLQAGERLQAGRREAYDFGAEEDVPDDFVDPTRAPNYDLADASMESRAVQGRLREQANLAKEKALADKEKALADEAEAKARKDKPEDK